MTNAARFQALHEVALASITRLHQQFRVERTEHDYIDAERQLPSAARPQVALTPEGAGAAPMTVAFTTFPGLMVRFGHFVVRSFPSCGCDACDESAEGESQAFDEWIDAVVNGRFTEALERPWLGGARVRWRIWGPDWSRSGGEENVARARLRTVGGPRNREFRWVPWERR